MATSWVMGQIGGQRVLGLGPDLVPGTQDLLDLVLEDDGLDEVIEGRIVRQADVVAGPRRPLMWVAA